jgi:bifunctional ADP-heptose synthase (sugar kinase/adenylyltransferase)
MLIRGDRPAQELNRLDIKNRSRLGDAEGKRVLQALDDVVPQVDALVISDQVSEAECGVITTRVRERLAELGRANPEKLILADSRNRIGLFRSVTLKPNQAECVRAVQGDYRGPEATESCVRELARRTGRPVFCTRCEQGILLFDPRRADGQPVAVPAYPVSGSIDVVGAGDSVSAGIACAVAAGATLEQAAGFGNLVASITIQQIGVTGTASPEQVRQRWREVGGA